MINWQRIQDLKNEIGAAVFDQVVVLFLDEADEASTRLKAATTAPEMKSALHALKGNALNMGFTDLAKLCQSCESRAEAGETDLPLDEVYATLASARAEFLTHLPDMGKSR